MDRVTHPSRGVSVAEWFTPCESRPLAGKSSSFTWDGNCTRQPSAAAMLKLQYSIKHVSTWLELKLEIARWRQSQSEHVLVLVLLLTMQPNHGIVDCRSGTSLVSGEREGEFCLGICAARRLAAAGHGLPVITVLLGNSSSVTLSNFFHHPYRPLHIPFLFLYL